MLAELFNIAKEHIPQNKAKAVKSPTESIDALKLAIENRKEYAKVFNDAQGLVEESFKEKYSPEALEIVKEYLDIENPVTPPYSEKTLLKAMREAIKLLNIDNMEIDTDNADSIKRILRNYLVRRTADYNNDRRVMGKEIDRLVDKVIKVKKQQQMFWLIEFLKL